MKQTSNFLQLNGKDFVKGLLMAFIGALITGLMTSLNAVPPSFPMDWIAWKPIVMGGVVMALTYFTKNFLTNSKDEFLKQEKPNP